MTTRNTQTVQYNLELSDLSVAALWRLTYEGVISEEEYRQEMESRGLILLQD